MIPATQQTESRPGIPVNMGVKMQVADTAHPTEGTVQVDIRGVEHLLSTRPLRRRNRDRPLEN